MSTEQIKIEPIKCEPIEVESVEVEPIEVGPIKIEQMQKKDSEIVAQLEQTIFSDSWSERSILETWQQKQSIILVARENKEILGYLIAYHVLDEVEIVRLAVIANARRQGIAGKLLAVLTETRDISSVVLEVREQNASARNFYQKQSFVEVGIRKHFYQNPTDHAILMKRDNKKDNEEYEE